MNKDTVKETTKEKTTAKQQEAKEIVYMEVKGNVLLNVRERQNINGEILGRLHPASKVAVLETHDKWVKIKQQNLEGYVLVEYLK